MTCAGASAVVVADGSPGFCIDEGRSFSTNRNDRVCHQPRLGGGLPGRFSGIFIAVRTAIILERISGHMKQFTAPPPDTTRPPSC